MITYLFDFDGTIYDGDSSIDFFLFCLKKNKKIMLNIPKIILAIVLYKIKIINKTKMKEVYFSFLKKIKDIDILVEEFWNQNDHKIKKFFLQRKRNKDIIISASPYFLLSPISKKYNVKDLIASNVDKNTGKFLEENCLGKKKVEFLFKKYPKIKIKEMYSDSLKDGPLLELADKGYIVIKEDIYPYGSSIRKTLKKKKIINMYNDNQEIINYIIVGILTVIINLIIKWSLLFTIFDANNSFQLQTSVVLSWIGAVVFAYIANRIIVFKSKNKKVFKEIISFLSSRILTLLVEMGIMWFLFTLLQFEGDMVVLIWTILVQIIVIILNYIFSKLFVFKK
ncbi:MAG: HAD-IB family phosphatase [Bacilli bacterium]|nr:HAD-IB family phosphatase [Bacilli bacterium]